MKVAHQWEDFRKRHRTAYEDGNTVFTKTRPGCTYTIANITRDLQLSEIAVDSEVFKSS